MKKIEYVINEKRIDASNCNINEFDAKTVNDVYEFHKTLPNYEASPLADLDNLANLSGVKKIWVKDESKRFGLNAFKALGGSYAMAKVLAKKLNKDISELPYNVLISNEIKKQLGEITFVTATDGNHGRGIAWMANKLNQKSVVYMPKGSSKERLDNILKEGSDATITELGYDDAVRLASQKEKEEAWVLVQDTAWDGYEEIPMWIMQGYMTIIKEAEEQIKANNDELPTHIFLQAGVGSFAGAILGYLVQTHKENRPISIICEPHGANCIYKSIKANDGNPHNCEGELNTIMAGLSCGEPNTVSWKILRDYANASISCDDSVSAHGMRVLGNPLKDDLRIISGESGAVGLGLTSILLSNKEEYKNLLKALKIDENSRILCISTEGDTDEAGYRSVVWDGAYSN